MFNFQNLAFSSSYASDINRIYLNYLQNTRAKTLASGYSIRPKPGTLFSASLEWMR
ncbi:hypothetical protein [Chryseobacterium sp. SIMBA_028]|uniref:non-homologous end-joining DNA ligase LigD n=1 Tax=Chryseobacterium sp. SIMBA_028 TaxID=3085771 RepID=UPI00397C1EEE